MLENIVPILTNVFTVVAFIQFLRFAQVRGANIYAFAPINFITAAAVFIAWGFIAGLPIDNLALIAGAGIGAFYGVTFFLLLHCIRIAGVGKASTTLNLSMAIPIVISIFIWNETPNNFIWSGIALTALAIPLILLPTHNSQPKAGLNGIFCMLVLFVAQGIIGLIFKWFETQDIPAQQPVMLAAVFVIAAAITLVISIFKKTKPRQTDIGCGIIVGLLNMAINASFIICLTRADASQMMPILTGSAVALTVITSIILWKERYTKRTYIGIIFAIIAVILLRG